MTAILFQSQFAECIQNSMPIYNGFCFYALGTVWVLKPE